MAVAGLRGTGDWGTDERPKNFREFILWRDPNGSSPLQALMAKTRTESTDDPEYSWWEEELNPIRLLTTTAHTTTEAVIDIDSGDAEDLVAGDVLMVETAEDVTYTNELVLVASIASTTQFTVTRAGVGTTGATIPDNTFLTKIGNAYEEGSTSPTASSRNPSKKSNFTQIFKTAYRLTETAKATRARTGPALDKDKKRKAFDHAVALEFAYLFGKRNEGTGAGGKPIRHTGGLLFHLALEQPTTAHVIKIYTTTTTENTFLDDVYKTWDYRSTGRGGMERIALAGNGALNALNKVAKAGTGTRINHAETIKLYGMELQRWVFPQGSLLIKTHPLMNVHGRFANSMFVLNPGGVVDRPLRKTRPEDHIEANDADEHKGQWLTESGPEYNHMKTFIYFGAMNTMAV